MIKNLFNRLQIIFLWFAIVMIIPDESCFSAPFQSPVRVTVEMNIGEILDVKLSNGDKVQLKLLKVDEIRDNLRNAIRGAKVKLAVDGEEITLPTGNYNLPVRVGKVQIDCPSIRGYFQNAPGSRSWLSKDACFRLWPKDSPYMKPGTFVYPIKQAWFAGMTQSGNEPTYVDWGENPANKRIYYHSGHDIGGAEGMDEIVSATDGIVISANNKLLEGYFDFPGDARQDGVYIVNDIGWCIRYLHLDSTDPEITPGAKVKMGQRIGFIGKQGDSGGWVHLHFEIKSRDLTSGMWGTENAYPYVWEAYVRQYDPAIIAVARPHQFSWAGEEVSLDGRKSKSFKGNIVSYDWTYTDGSKASGPVQKRVYNKPGEYSEILKVTDSKGNAGYDFAVVQIRDKQEPETTYPVMQPAFHPTLNIKPGDPVTFLVRTFNTSAGNEIWDFGDGSPKVTIKSETVNLQKNTEGKFAETVHSFAKPGHYVVRVERSNEASFKAITHLHVEVGK